VRRKSELFLNKIKEKKIRIEGYRCNQNCCCSSFGAWEKLKTQKHQPTGTHM